MDEKELIAQAGKSIPLAAKGPAGSKVLNDEDLAGMFGLDMADIEAPAKIAPAAKARKTSKRATKAKRYRS